MTSKSTGVLAVNASSMTHGTITVNGANVLGGESCHADAMSERSAKEVVDEMVRRQEAGDDTALDDLVAEDMVNHAAGPQGRAGLKLILEIIDQDLGPITVEQHHLVGDGDTVAQHLTLHGTHRGSTMPLLAGTPVSGRPVAWRFIHIWQVADGVVVEHWACRDDMDLLAQVRD